MKTFIKLSLIIITLTNFTNGQTVTVTSNTYLNSIGTTLTHISGNIDTSQTQSVDLGSPGENQTWDLRNIRFTDTTVALVQENLTPEETDYPDLFSDANYAIRITAKSITSTDTIEVPPLGSTNYYKVTSMESILLGGIVGTFFGIDTAKNKDTTLLPQQHNYGESWTTVNKDTNYISFGSSSYLNSISYDSTENIIDAYGILKLPLGDFECVRIKSYTTSIDSDFASGITMETHINYAWENKDGVLLATINSQPNETNPNYTNPSGFMRLENMTGTTVGITEIKPIVNNYRLEQNYPNPFNPTTTIEYSIPRNLENQTSNVKLIVYDILGRKIKTLVNKNQQFGNYSVRFDASSLPSGTYYYRLNAGNNIITKKMILLK